MNAKDISPYNKINLIFICILLAVFVYSLVFSPEKGNHIIPSSTRLLDSPDTVSTGLSRAFSALVRFKFEEARDINPHSSRVFLFFLLQLILRITGIISFWQSRKQQRKWIVGIDIGLSIALFMYCFEPFWHEMFY